MKAYKPAFDILTQTLNPTPHSDGEAIYNYLTALELNQSLSVNSVSGTAIAGTLSGSDKIFTRTAGYWYQDVIIPISSVTGTFVAGEAVTEATSSAAGVISKVYSDKLVITTVTVAAFVGAKTLTGGTSGATATGGTPSAKVLDLKGQYVWSHKTGNTKVGKWNRVLANTATTVTTAEAMFTGGTSIIIAADEDAANAAMDIAVSTGYAPVAVQALTTASPTVTTNPVSKVYVLVANTTSNAVQVTLPDSRLVPARTQILIIVPVLGSAKAFTVKGYNAAQTLDGTDINGTPLATMDAEGDYILIEESAGKWITQVNGISA